VLIQNKSNSNNNNNNNKNNDGAPILSHHPMKYVQITSNKPETIKYKVFPVY